MDTTESFLRALSQVNIHFLHVFQITENHFPIATFGKPLYPQIRKRKKTNPSPLFYIYRQGI